MLDVITIGAATRDVFILSKAFMLIPLPELGGNLAECVSLGSKIEIDTLVQTTGGGATNAAVTFARLGFHTATVSRVGNDVTGNAVIDELQSEKIDTRFVKKIKGGQTAYSTLLTAMNGERTALVFRGVSGEFSENDIPAKMQAAWLYMTSLDGSIPALLRAVRTAKTQQMLVAFNPGGGEIKTGLRALDPILRQVTVLLVNLEEAQQLTGLQTTDVREIAGKLLRPGMTLIITDSAHGAHAFDGVAHWHSSTRAIRSISRTGAGDAFGSGFVAARMRGYDVADALRIGTLNAENVIGHVGAKTGIISSWPSKKVIAAVSVTQSA